MAAKRWEEDFRFPAISASIRCLGDQYDDDPFQYPGSFCLPIAEKPVVGWTPGKVSLIAIALGFGLLIAGIALMSYGDAENPGPKETAALIAGAFCGVLGIATFFIPVKFDRLLIRWMLGQRGSEMLQRSYDGDVLSAELSDADSRNVTISIDGDDHVLIMFDSSQRRLMIEGIGARYQIRAKDVVMVQPFEFLNYVGAEIICRIDEDTFLRVAIARISLVLEITRQLPFLFFLKKRISNPILTRASETLGLRDLVE